MNVILFRKYCFYIWIGLISAVLLVGGISCCTFEKRDLQFENQIQIFVDQSVPGSEINLLNGTNLGGWFVHGMGMWTVENGVLSVRRGLGYLATRCNTLSDYELSLDIRISSYGNSGVFVRAKHPGLLFRPWPQGYEAQVFNHSKKNPTGSIYNIQPASHLTAKDNEWFSLKIKTIKNVIEVTVNDETVSSITNADQNPGFIALQAHDPWSTVEFRNIILRIPDNNDS